MPLDHRLFSPLPLAAALAVGLAGPACAGPAASTRPPESALPAYLPRYRVDVDLDTDNGLARVRQVATWINPHSTPTDRLVFNAHSRYVVPSDQIGFMAKMLEILRVQPSEALGYSDPPCEVHSVTLVGEPGCPRPLSFHYQGDTKTDLVVPLPHPVAAGQSVTVELDLTFRVPAKQGRWSRWEGVLCLSNWLPVFAYYGEAEFGPRPPAAGPDEACPGPLSARGSRRRPRVIRASSAPPGVAQEGPGGACWQPTPFVPWHQPFFNEAGVYDVSVTLPCDQQVACSGSVLACTTLAGGRKRLDIQAVGVREFSLLCSARYCVSESEVDAGPGGAAVKVRVLAFREHEFYAAEMVDVARKALAKYADWYGPYPWPEFTVAEAFFGWNGNECSTLVMIDERVFGMPHVAVGYVEYLLTHEIGHQWWYNLVGTNGYCETFMDEAPTNYFSHKMLNERHGKNNPLMNYPAGLSWLPNIHRDDYRSSGMYGSFGRGENMAVVQEMPKFGHLVNLFNMCYDKGSRIVGTIEQALGECAFHDFIRRVIRKYQFRVLSIANFQRELEAYTGGRTRDGRTWQEFFDTWLYSAGLSDWSVEKVTLARAPLCRSDQPICCLWRKRLLLARGQAPEEECADAIPEGGVRLQVWVAQKCDYDEPTYLGIALEGCEGYPIRIPILPRAQAYRTDDPRAKVTPLEPAKKGGARLLVEVTLPCEPTQVAIDPDQVLVDADPANNYWHTPLRWRITPLYTFLEETDLTCAYDRWNVLAGPWLYSPTYESAWFTRSTMVGVRAGAYRTQEFSGGLYAGYRTNFRDVVAGLDAEWEHWPWPTSQAGLVVERRLQEFNNGQPDALRAVAWGRYIFTYGSSLYLPPIHFLESFAQYSDNFLPFATQTVPTGIRYDRTMTMGLHYRLNYLTPYWDPEGGFQVDAWYEGGVANDPSTVGLHKLGGNLVLVKSPPSLSAYAEGVPLVQGALEWLAATRVAVRAYGATASPAKGEFFSMGGSELFRGFDLAQRQGSAVWVGSVEWRVPLARRTTIDALDHIAMLRNLHAAVFYDVGDAYTSHRSVGPVAHGVGVGLRLDVSWFSFVERTTVRLDVAKAVNLDTGLQVWFGINHPF